MCKAKNILHNLYSRPHNLFTFTDNKDKTVRHLHEKVQHILQCSVLAIYDIETIDICYTDSSKVKKQKLADIKMSPYMDEQSYVAIIENLESYFTGKIFSVVHLNETSIYLYHNSECVNTSINNILTYHDMHG